MTMQLAQPDKRSIQDERNKSSEKTIDDQTQDIKKKDESTDYRDHTPKEPAVPWTTYENDVTEKMN
jgi:hypothetical protein